jgi:hypothetical protein
MMAKTYSELVRPRGRFRKSANLERDLAAHSLAGFIPTSRTIEAVGRVVDAIQVPDRPRAVSITGPYGSGKSSLAVFLSALFGPPGRSRASADALLADADPQLFERLRAARSPYDATGFVLAFASASREPISRTLARALLRGLEAYGTAIEVGTNPIPDSREGTSVLGALKAVTEIAPVLMVIDEFGKSLEEFVATGTADADLYILQELAEWASGDLTYPFVLMTLQHLSFEDYGPTSHSNKRREWSKIQGRFLDVPYVENSRQWQHLMASVYVYDARLDVTEWSREAIELIDQAGLSAELHIKPESVFPLHPLTAIALPELCVRYGQHERTLFSFLAGSDNGSVPSHLEEWVGAGLPLVYLHDVFDYFFESASHFAGGSASASRWIEVGTRIRDVVGCTPSELRVLKSVAVLNLISAGGSVRASRAVIVAGLASGLVGSDFSAAIEEDLQALEDRGVLVFREFADEYRLWHGSDFDIRGALEVRKAALVNESTASLIERIKPPTPVIAARHSQLGGILRVFDKRFVDEHSRPVLNVDPVYDGVVLLALASSLKSLPEFTTTSNVPIVIGTSSATRGIAPAAVELAACRDLLADASNSAPDWVSRKEISERAAIAEAELDSAIDRAYAVGAANLRWSQLGDRPRRGRPEKPRSLSETISRMCDERYPDAPVIKNEMIARRQLTSQGAQARRNLLEAMVMRPTDVRLGIDGFGPERAMYEALLGNSGMHQLQGDGSYALGCPKAENDPLGFRPAWMAVESLFAEAEARSIALLEVYQKLMAAPFGLKEGPIPVVILAALVANKETIAVFENNSFAPRVDVPLVERLIRNPEAFTLRRYDPAGPRRRVLEAVFREFSTGWRQSDDRSVRTLLSAVTPLLDAARSLNPYAQRTKSVSAQAQQVRAAIQTATEPGELLFRSLPEALRMNPFDASGVVMEDQASAFAAALKAAMAELTSAFPMLLERIERDVFAALQASGASPRLSVSSRASALRKAALDPEMRSLVFALTHDGLEREEWLTYLGMVVLGTPVASWGDDDAQRFAHELGSKVEALRRLESLAIATSSNEGFEVVQLSFSSIEHGDFPRVIWLDPGMSEEVDRVAADALSAIERRFGPAAREHLLASLAKVVLAGSSRDGNAANTMNAKEGGPQ